MSYVRLGENGSDVYVYDSALGGFECCACKLDATVAFLTRSGMIAHLQEHIAAGHVVPAYAIERLQEEIETEGDEWEPVGGEQ